MTLASPRGTPRTTPPPPASGPFRRLVATPPPPATIALAVVAALLLALAAWISAPTPPPRCAPIGLPTQQDRTPLPDSAPLAVTVESIDTCSTLQPVGVDATRQIEVPSVHTPEQAGWYRLGPSPGELGPAVVVGHVNGDGRAGVFADLEDVGTGDRVAVARRDGRTAHFTVTGAIQVAKADFPTRAVYGDTRDPQLRLITCGGALDRTAGRYSDNIVVFATYDGWSPTRA